MSYEGYDQLICKKGHYWIQDSVMRFCSADSDVANQKCPSCKEVVVWYNAVDLTNGCEPIDTNNKKHDDNCQCGVVGVEILDEAQLCVCKCGDRHYVTIPTFKIPEDKGHKV